MFFILIVFGVFILFQIQECNVLFIDSPVGSGWSYVDGPEYYTTDMAGITADLTETLRMFLDDTPELKVCYGNEHMDA